MRKDKKGLNQELESLNKDLNNLENKINMASGKTDHSLSNVSQHAWGGGFVGKSVGAGTNVATSYDNYGSWQTINPHPLATFDANHINMLAHSIATILKLQNLTEEEKWKIACDIFEHLCSQFKFLNKDELLAIVIPNAAAMQALAKVGETE